MAKFDISVFGEKEDSSKHIDFIELFVYHSSQAIGVQYFLQFPYFMAKQCL